MFDRIQSITGRTGPGLVDLAEAREHPGRFVALGVVLATLGALAILVPLATTLVTVLVIGWLLVVGGIAEAAHAVIDRRRGRSGWEIVSALIHVVAGALVIAFPLTAKLAVTLVLTAFLIGDGVLKIIRAVQHRGFPAWGWLLFDGIAALVLGVLLWLHWPSAAVWALGLLVGINLFFGGVSMLAIGLGARQAAQARP
jgi:uncharacterized membrane protein HdeD (DUF308 family)